VYSNTGTEAIQVALRLARAATGRNLIIKFEGHYHGWADSILIGHRHAQPIRGASREKGLLGNQGQSPSVLQDILVLPWNNMEILESTFREHGDRVAAVINEPMQCNTASLLPNDGYLERLRELTTRHGAALIFDEVITGFRLAPGGASEYFGVSPDLAVFAKAVAGGHPLSVVAGTSAMFSAVENGGVRHLGTFNGNPIALAGAAATLDILFDPAEDVYGRMRRLGARLLAGLRALSRPEIPILVQGLPACFQMFFTEEKAIRNYGDYAAYDMSRTQRWSEAALHEGIFQMGDGRWYVSGVHTDDDITLTLEKVERALKRLASPPAVSLPIGAGH
ncbi:MAG: aspartate aminotransferase family protein, partial [Opitutaceae bacterium]